MKNDSIEVCKGKKYRRKGTNKTYLVTGIEKDAISNKTLCSFVEISDTTGKILNEEINFFKGIYFEVV